MTRRPAFLTSPHSWTRSSRHVTDAARDACALEHIERKTNAAAGVILAVVIAILLAALFIHWGTCDVC